MEDCHSPAPVSRVRARQPVEVLEWVELYLYYPGGVDDRVVGGVTQSDYLSLDVVVG